MRAPAPAPNPDIRTHNKPVRCRHCGVAGWALHRGPETAHEWRKYPAIQRKDGLFVADLSQPIHECEQKPAPALVDTLRASIVATKPDITTDDPEADAWSAAQPKPVRKTSPEASEDVIALVRTLGILVRTLEAQLNIKG